MHTRYRTTRRARASVPHVARVTSLMRFLQILRSSLSAAKQPAHQHDCATKISALRWLVTVTLSGAFHSRACHTFRSCTVQIAHVNALFGLSRISRPREATFVVNPAYCAIQRNGLGPTTASLLVTKWFRSVALTLPKPYSGARTRKSSRMTANTRQLFDHLMSLRPSVGFMSLPTTFFFEIHRDMAHVVAVVTSVSLNGASDCLVCPSPHNVCG